MTRSPALFAASFALAALLVAACSPSAPVPEVPQTVRREVAARVNGEAIYTSDIEIEAAARGLVVSGAALTADDEAYAEVLDQMIDQKLMAQEALRKGLDRDPFGQRRLELARERILGNLLVENLVAEQVTDEAVDRIYSEQVRLQQLNDQVSIAHILTETEAEAQAVWLRIRAGESFESLVFNHSKDTATRMENGDLGYVAPNDQLEPFPLVIANTAVGEVSAPFESEAGWHILKVKDRRTRPPKTREEMRPEIATLLTFGEVSRILRRLRAEAEIARGGESYEPDPPPALPSDPLLGDDL